MAPDVPIPHPSGASVHVSELAGSLTAEGHEVHVVARRTKGGDKPQEDLGGVTLHRIYRLIFFGQPHWSRTGGAYDRDRTGIRGRLYYTYLVTVFALYVSLVVSRIVRKNRIDVILERETSFGAGGLASLFTGRPLILEIIGPRYSLLSARRSSRILYYTESMLNDRTERSKCVLVSAGVNLEIFRSDENLGLDTRTRLGITHQDKVVGYVGTFQDWHGVDILLKAVRNVRESGKAVKLVLVGPFTTDHLETARKMGVAEACRFIGPVKYNEVPAYINACDVMVAPYNPSANPLRRAFGIGSPLKLLEYMACEKPVISTEVDPIRKLPSISEAGVLVEPGNAGELAQSIAKLVDDDEARRRMGRRGRSLVETSFSWGPLAERISTMIQTA